VLLPMVQPLLYNNGGPVISIQVRGDLLKSSLSTFSHRQLGGERIRQLSSVGENSILVCAYLSTSSLVVITHTWLTYATYSENI
jgi:hypothetical protein